MMHPNTISSLIEIRAFLENAVDNLHIKLTREDVKNVQNRVAAIDKVIIEQSLKLNFDNLNDESKHVVKEYNFTSTEDVLGVVKKDTDDESTK